MSFVDTIVRSNAGAKASRASGIGRIDASRAVGPAASDPAVPRDTVTISAEARALSTPPKTPAPRRPPPPIQVRVTPSAVSSPAVPAPSDAAARASDQAIERGADTAAPSALPPSGEGDREGVRVREGDEQSRREVTKRRDDERARSTASGSERVNAQVQRMRVQEREVRRTQVMKAAVGGAFAGDSTYQFALGPDGRRYIVGGDVSLDVSPVENNPRATISKMQRVRAAAGLSVQRTQNDRVATFMSVRTEGSARSQLAKMADLGGGPRSRVGVTVDVSA